RRSGPGEGRRRKGAARARLGRGVRNAGSEHKRQEKLRLGAANFPEGLCERGLAFGTGRRLRALFENLRRVRAGRLTRGFGLRLKRARAFDCALDPIAEGYLGSGGRRGKRWETLRVEPIRPGPSGDGCRMPMSAFARSRASLCGFGSLGRPPTCRASSFTPR